MKLFTCALYVAAGIILARRAFPDIGDSRFVCLVASTACIAGAAAVAL